MMTLNWKPSPFWLLGWMTLSLSFWMSLTPHSAEAKQETVWMAVSGDLRGEIRPCGCSPEGDMGGLLRRATYLKELRSLHPAVLYLNLGNNFPKPSEQGELKVELTQTAMKTLNPHAVLVGPNELQYGLKKIDLELPYFVTNIRPDSLPFETHRIIEMQGRTIGVWGYLSPTQVYQNKNEEQTFLPVNETLLDDWKKKLETTKLTTRILLFRGNEAELSAFEKSQLFDVIIPGSNNDDEANQVLTMSTPDTTFAAIPTKGQGVLNAELPKSGAPQNWDYAWLYQRNWGDYEPLVHLYETYDKEVKELFFANLDRMDAHKENSPYVGAQTCQGCHLETHKIWSQTRHADAFATLEKQDKHFDMECLECHVVGLNNKGFLSPELTPILMNVQCENCHGPAKAHIQNPTQVHPPTIAKQSCATCHRGAHSPLFKYETYWPKIKHN